MDYPNYFRALQKASPVVAHDAHLDPTTREFSESYLKPAGTGAMLDVPVFVRGELTGSVARGAAESGPA